MSVQSTMPAMTFSEYLTLPEDRSVQLVDGRLEVTEPSYRHEEAIFRLQFALRVVLPPTSNALCVNWHINDRWAPAPDISVVERRDHGLWFRGVLALAVEVLSPSTRHVDEVVKRRGYAEAGLPFYWLVDLDVPCVVALQFVEGAFTEVARATGDTPADLPFDGGWLTLTASDLLDD